MKKQEIPQITTAPIPWTKTFKELHFLDLWLPDTNAGVNNTYRLEVCWQITLHWVFKKKWGGKKYKIPCKPKVAKAFEPFGELMHRYLALTIECHAVNPYNYRNATHWFKYIVRESQQNSLELPTHSNKREKIDSRKRMINCLVGEENPIDRKVAPNEWKLIETATKMLDSIPFQREFWKPYLKAYRAWNQTLRTPDWGSLFEKDEILYLQRGRGKGSIPLNFIEH